VLGVCTRYCHHEAPQVAMRIANWWLDRGLDATLFSTTLSPPRLDPQWDREVARTSKLRFTDWALNCSTILWTHIPHKEQIDWCNKAGINTVIYPFWHELRDQDRPALKIVNWIVSPNVALARLLASKFGIRKTLVAPYDSGLPLTCKDTRLKPNYIWVLLPLYDREPEKTEATAIEVAGRLLAAREDVVVTTLYNSSTLSSPAKRRLSEFRRYFGDRMRLFRSVSLRHRPMIFRDHDVTMWPAHFDSVGVTPAISLAMGTPVVSFAFPPITEMLTKENSVPVSCQGHYNRIGVPYVEPDYQLYERCLQNAVINRGYLTSLQQTVLTGLEQRRQVFNEVMGRVLC